MTTRDIARWSPLALAVALAGCDESFTATAGSGGSGTATGSGTTSAAGGSGGSGSGGGQTTTGGGGDVSCAPAPGDGCSECLVIQCTETYCGCAGSDDCVGFLECVAAGGANPQFSWYEKCWHDHKASISLAGNLTVCSSKHCPACNTPPVQPCLACQYANCPKVVNDCLSTSACTGYLACLQTCSDNGNPAGCKDNCDAEHADGIPLWQALYGCATNICANACQPAN